MTLSPRWVGCTLLASLAGCTPAPEPEPEAQDPWAEVTAVGPDETVGYRETELTYGGETGERTLRLAWWYPGVEGTGSETAYQGFFPADDSVRTGAEVVEGSDRPLVVFSHGHQGYAESSAFLMAHFASHGFVVVAPDHTGNTTFDGSDRDTEIYFERSADLSAVLDHALSGEPGLSDQLSGEVVAVGHSFGGYTLFASAGASFSSELPADCMAGTGPMPFCSTWDPDYETLFSEGFLDDRILGILPMAPGDYRLFAAGTADVEVPVLMMSGGLDDRVGEDAPPYWGALGGDPDHTWAHLPTAGHNTFTDFSGTIDQAEGLIEPDVGFELINGLALGWTRWLLGDEDYAGIRTGEDVVSDDVEFTVGG